MKISLPCGNTNIIKIKTGDSCYLKPQVFSSAIGLVPVGGQGLVALNVLLTAALDEFLCQIKT
ncbi:MAG: hypothetical protein JST02_15160 [Bacteroidetes bacterium]|nr:hypothetical protein [Bacteroidota bacterium]